MGYIYKITNRADNKIYVGQTIQDVEARWKDHLKKGSNCRYLKSAINKYGIDNFEFKLVCITFDNQLDDMEIKYIEKYNSLVPNGYNLRLGGNSGKHNAETKQKISETLKKKFANGLVHSRHQLGRPHDETTKQKISESLKGHKLSQETLNKMIATRIKNNTHKLSQETIDKMIATRIKNNNPELSEETINKMIATRIATRINNNIIQFDTQGNRLNSFDNCKEAGDYIGTRGSNISACCIGKTKTAKGYVWKYESIL